MLLHKSAYDSKSDDHSFTFIGLVVPRRPVVPVVVVDGDLLALGDVPVGHEAHDVAEPRVHQDRFKIAVWLVERAEIDISAGSILTPNNHESILFNNYQAKGKILGQETILVISES